MVKKHGIPIVGDPRRTTNYSIYQDFTLIKPNRKETEAAVGFTIKDQNDVLKAAEQLKAEVKLEYLVISLDRDGLLLFHNPENYHFFEAENSGSFRCGWSRRHGQQHAHVYACRTGKD